MWVLAVFVQLANGQAALDLFPMSSRASCEQRLAVAAQSFARDDNVRRYYVKCAQVQGS